MDNIDIITSGKKIKNIRKSLGLKQDEITGNEFTRNLISMIENDKVKLTLKAAEIIANNINNVCKQRNIRFNVSASYLLENEKMQANKIINEYIKFLNENSSKPSINLSYYIKEINHFLINNDVDINHKITIYNNIGDIFDNRNEYYSSYTYYLKAFENGYRILSNTELAELIVKIMYCCIKLNKYQQALDFKELTINYYHHLPDELKFKLSYNSALAYKKLDLYNESLKEIKYIINTFQELSISNKFNVLTLKSNCLKEIKCYKEALDEYKHTLSLLNSKDVIKQLVIICNVVDIYIYFADIKNIKICIDNSISIINDLKDLSEDYYLPQIYSSIATACIYIKNLDIAKDYYYKTISTAKINKQYELVIYSLENLFNIYSGENNLYELNNIRNQLLEVISIDKKLESHRLIYKFIDFYNMNNDVEGIKSLLNFVLKKE